ncbi:MFS transporter TsgA [Shigella sonnei]|uniref:MFS transporter TsgA n=1 Tax=Escherichia coli TaxID=562 RepID=UPI00005F2CFB|nr:MFS transporter TsgA [Escherichia coli]EFW9296953.1 MFS transporter TsgA [Shigella flexneri]ACD54502.1 major facilitator superfamily MFS_1 [Escherichia coli 53638]EFX2140511.1 MFS transporter TsgA [Shigella flexneri]HAY5394546.1 MFS transporter TsgA [Shigella flexneri]HDQ5678554.1 MFS transporter TsgA [Shigella flexneri]
MKNKIALTLISFLANFIMAGFASQFGMLIEPIAQRYDADINAVASIFSLLNGGALAGTIAAFFLIEKIGVKRMTFIIYSLVFLCAVVMHLSPTLWGVMVAMTVIGFCGGIGLCIAGTIVVSVWQDRIQSTMLVVQDATFNVAGVVFPLVTTYALTHNMSWSYSYLTVGVVALLTLAVVILTRFNLCELSAPSDSSPIVKSEWNSGIISGGIGLFLGMLALYTFLTWSPLFVKNKFGIPFEEAGNIITQYWAAALIGALVSTVIVTRVKIHYFLLCIISLACIITTIIVTKESLSGLDYLAYSYGFVCAALYNSFIAYGVSFVRRASSQNISYILISGSAGAMFSPAISSLMEKMMGLQKIMYAIPILYLVIFIMLVTTLKIKNEVAK